MGRSSRIMDKLISIVGPTASGKSGLAIDIAKELNTEIISLDSMQIYKYMDIGTAKITKEEMQGIKHYMIDMVDPSEEYSAALFCEQVKPIISKINQEGKIPVSVGGTGLYLNSLLYGFSFAHTDKSEDIRKSHKIFYEQFGGEKFLNKLRDIDPKSAENLHANDYKRISRALEIYELTGIPKSELNEKDDKVCKYNSIIFGIDVPREELYNRINLRVDEMVNSGLVDEVKGLLAKGYSKNLQAMQAIGYKEVIEHLEGTLSYEEMIYKIKLNTRHYAKRQLTWFRKNKDIVWLNYSTKENMLNSALKYIKERLYE